MKQWMIYGANGYTGKLAVAQAVEQGLSPVVAGRNSKYIKEIADKFNLEYKIFDLHDNAAVTAALKDMQLVLHCAGPFSATSQPMIEACLASACHYLDITGEIDVFANAQQQHAQAQRSDVVLIPGTGFDVVPTDCMAAMLVKKLPSATELILAFEAGGGPSPGTAKTSIEGLANGGRVRRDGEMVRVPLAYKTRTVPFAHAERHTMTIPWGDVFTAFISTGVPNIEVYLSVPPSTAQRLRRLRKLQFMLGWNWVQNLMKRRVDKTVSGPDDSLRDKTGCEIWGQVSSADGRTVNGTLSTPNGYDVTVSASLGIVRFLLQETVEGGYYTPSLLMGADYVTRLPGVSARFSE